MKITCDNVSKVIKKTTVLKEINLELEPGKIYGLWGKNGCGKTMLLRILSGLIWPTSGQVLVDGEILGKQRSFPDRMGLMIEQPSFLPGYTGMQNLKLLAGIRGEISEREIAEAMERAGLDPGDRRTYRKYSLGMQQRLGIACAIMEKPELLLLDEPINALDVNGVELVRTILREEREKGTLIVVSCHDAAEMEALADVVFLMRDGKIEEKREMGGEALC